MSFGIVPSKNEGEAVDTDPGAPKRTPLTADQQLRHDMLFQWRIANGHLEDAFAIAARLNAGYATVLRASIRELERDFHFVAGPDAVAEEENS